jgi:hypothetical protein
LRFKELEDVHYFFEVDDGREGDVNRGLLLQCKLFGSGVDDGY